MNEYYTKLWIVSRKQLEDLRNKDIILEKTTKPMTDRPLAQKFIGDLYCKYCMVVQNLAACADQSLMAQKTFTMKKLVDSAVIRLNELKEMFVYQLNFSEIYYLDDNMIEQKLVPQDIQIVEPDFACDRPIEIEDMWTAIKNGETIYVPPPPTPRESADANTQTDFDELPKEKQQSVHKFHPPVVILSPEEVIELERKERLIQVVLLIQTHERARQSRMYYYDLDVKRKLCIKAQYHQLTPAAPIEAKKEAATVMQKFWRGREVRKRFKRQETERLLLIGMTDSGYRSSKLYEENVKAREDRRQQRYRQLRDYVQASIDEKTRLLRVIGPRLLEDITDEIRVWFHKWYSQLKKFDKYPNELVGGSILIVRDETISPKEFQNETDKFKKLKEKGIDPAKLEKDKKAAEKKAAKELKKKQKQLVKKEKIEAKKREAAGLLLLKFGESGAANLFKEGFTEQANIWDHRPDSENPLFKPDMGIIHDERAYEVQLEIREEVDVLMRIELDLLNRALAKDTKKKYKPPKKPKAKKKKGKKKGKDLTATRTTEDLFQELVDNGIIHTYPKAKLHDFKGDYSYNNIEKRGVFLDPLPCLGDLRHAVMVNCILPLGVNTMVRPKSVLIAGPPQSGKHLLANAIFNETRCVLFDISPPVLAGKYQGKKAMTMLVHLINKMSRLLQPSIIFIDGAEKPFYKKVPETEKELEPKKMGSVLMKGIIKPIKPDDKVLVLGITKNPMKAQGKIKKVFQRILLIPRPDYGSLYVYLKDLLMSYKGIDRNFSVSELARLTLYHPFSLLKSVIENILTPARISLLSSRPFDAHEVIEALLDAPPIISDKEWNKLEKWFMKTPLCKRRTRLLRKELEGGSKKKKK